MLLTEDPQMQPVQTPFGVVTFLQVWHSRGGFGISQAWDALSTTFYSALISKVLFLLSLPFLSYLITVDLILSCYSGDIQ